MMRSTVTLREQQAEAARLEQGIPANPKETEYG